MSSKNKVKIIAFCGKMGVGKSTAIEILKEISDADIALVKFAGPLYDIQEYIYKKISPVYKRPSNFVKSRPLLQFLGTEFGRSIDPDLWVKLWKEEVANITEMAAYNRRNTIIVCDDCRFDNEAQAIKDLDGIVIKITSNKNLERITTANGIANHASELGVSEKFITHCVTNNDSIEEYRAKLRTLYTNLFEVTN